MLLRLQIYGGERMDKMTRTEMISFLKGMTKKQAYLEEEKQRIKGSVESLEEAIERNNFSRNHDDSGIIAGTFSPDKIFRVLLNSQDYIYQYIY